MKVLLLCCLVGVALASPGGYIAKGGVFDFKRPLDYMGDAVQAGKVAWNKRFESELDSGAEETRGERNAPNYIPTFFTSQQNHEALTASSNRPQRQTAQIEAEPLYYETYHGRR